MDFKKFLPWIIGIGLILRHCFLGNGKNEHRIAKRPSSK